MGFIFRNQREPKKFGLKHRIYDERKEELRRKMEDKSEIEIFEESKSAYRDRMRARMGRVEENRKASMRFNFRIIVIFAVLATILAIALGSIVAMDQIIELDKL